MKKISMYKFLISLILILTFNLQTYAHQNKFVSLSPSATEIMYSLGAQNQLLAVSTTCTYPKDAQLKPKIGNTFFIDKEKILKLKPDYILAPNSTASVLADFNKLNIKPLCYQYDTINDIYKIILDMGKLTDKEIKAQKIIANLKNDIQQSKTHNPQKILYLIQVQPMITIGNKSFISDVIKQSGQISVTQGIKGYYPTISEEYALKTNPDIVIISFYSDTKLIKKLFPHAKIVFMSEEQNNIINRPSTRINKSIKFFANL